MEGGMESPSFSIWYHLLLAPQLLGRVFSLLASTVCSGGAVPPDAAAPDAAEHHTTHAEQLQNFPVLLWKFLWQNKSR